MASFTTVIRPSNARLHYGQLPLAASPQLRDLLRSNFQNLRAKAVYSDKAAYLVGGDVGQIGLRDTAGDLLACGMVVVGGRQANQDSILAQKHGQLIRLIVSDGVSGNANGELASKFGVLGAMDCPAQDPVRILEAAAQRVFSEFSSQRSSNSPAATLALTCIEPLTGRIQAVALGDSLIFLRRKQGEIFLLNLPQKMAFFTEKRHDSVHDFLKILGSPPYDEANINIIFERIKRSKARNIMYSFLGDTRVIVDYLVYDRLEQGDSLIVVSDGMSLEPADIRKMFRTDRPLRQNVRRLVLESLCRNGLKGDNVSVLAYTQQQLPQQLAQF